MWEGGRGTASTSSLSDMMKGTQNEVDGFARMTPANVRLLTISRASLVLSHIVKNHFRFVTLHSIVLTVSVAASGHHLLLLLLAGDRIHLRIVDERLLHEPREVGELSLHVLHAKPVHVLRSV